MPPCGLRYGRGFQRNSSKDAIVWVHFTDADVCSLPGLHSERADVHIQQWPEQKLGQRWNAPELHDLVNEIKDVFAETAVWQTFLITPRIYAAFRSLNTLNA